MARMSLALPETSSSMEVMEAMEVSVMVRGAFSRGLPTRYRGLAEKVLGIPDLNLRSMGGVRPIDLRANPAMAEAPHCTIFLTVPSISLHWETLHT